jgi:Cdc6-like AAA superfamily ATPase
MTQDNTEEQAHSVVKLLAKYLGNSAELSYEIKDRADGPFLVFHLAYPTDRFFRILKEVVDSLPEASAFKDRVTIQTRKNAPVGRLQLPETYLLRTALSESLTVDRYTFGDDYFTRYTPSVTDLERQITSNANYIVYGRRGSGKSSLLAYAMHHLIDNKAPFAWISMQAYANQGGVFVTADIFRDILSQLSQFKCPLAATLSKEVELLNGQSMNELRKERTLERLASKIRGAIGTISQRTPVTIFLDDLHLLKGQYQPTFLHHLYSLTRGNRSYIKASGIEQFTRLWNATSKKGLEPVHDAQILKLDHNLTVPDKSFLHIQKILDTHARFCGLPSVSYLTGSRVLERLVWVAAAVPRDALNLFSLAISKGLAKDEKKVSVTSINAAASEMAEQKLGDIDKDISEEIVGARNLLEQIKEFCVSKQRKNAFLFEIRNKDTAYNDMQRLIALRLVHVLHEGITPHEAGRRFLALMLDYGFYVGIRAATSVDLFQKEPRALTAKELRKLPIFKA